MKRLISVFLFSISFFITSCTKDDRLQEAMDSFQLEPGLRIELVAAEPLVADPVAIVFDQDRRMYVVEDRGYPDPIEGPPTHLGRVALLEDTDGDGTYGHRSEFATGLTYPNGVLPWRGGIFVTCSPDIFYFKDTDGDGVADVKRMVLTGFSDKKTAQLRISDPTLGIEGWVYITGGLTGGNVTSPLHPERPAVSYTSADGRFNPKTFEFESIGGKSQFGLAFDLYGRRFGTSNRHPVMHIALEPRYLQLNPYFLFTESIENVSKVGVEATVFPISNAPTSHDYFPKLIGLSHAGTFRSASGLIMINGTRLTSVHQGNFFVCEPAQNLVQRQAVYSEGVSFRSELVYEGREFLSSTDEWFRPVYLESGPEGALYVIDMHRKTIDHPAYFPEEARDKLDLESGKSDGRIYRIVREGFREGKSDGHVNLSSSASTAEIVRALVSSEEWERATAYRVLLERKDMASVPMLRKCATESTLPASRVRALWLLHSLGALKPSTVKVALSYKEAGVRENAVLLVGKLAKKHTGLVHAIIAAALHEAIRVRFNSALVIGSLEGPGVVPALAKIAARDGALRWELAAVPSGIGKSMAEFLAAFRYRQSADSVAFAAVMQDLDRLFGNGAPIADSRALLNDVIYSDGGYDWRISTAVGLAEGISGRAEVKNPQKSPLSTLQGESASKADQRALDKFITQVAVRAGDISPKILIDHRAESRMLKLTGRTQREQIGINIAHAVNSILPTLKENIEWSPEFKHKVQNIELSRRRISHNDIYEAKGTWHKPEVETVPQTIDRLLADYNEMSKNLEENLELKKEENWYGPISAAYWRLSRAVGLLNKYQLERTDPTITSEVHAVRIGDMAIITNPFELYIDFGMQMKARSKAVQTFVVQLAGEGTYVPTHRAVAGGTYGAIPQSNTIGPEGGRQLVNQSLDLIDSLWPQEGQEAQISTN